jgi:hypothetical protein
MDLIIGQGDMIFEGGIPEPTEHPHLNIMLPKRDRVDRAKGGAGELPFLELDLFGVCACLGCDELLEVADGVIWRAFHSDCHDTSGVR